MSHKNQLRALDISQTTTRGVRAATNKRLAAAVACLERIEMRRGACGASLLDRIIEKWVIWRELLQLELQSIAERRLLRVRVPWKGPYV